MKQASQYGSGEPDSISFEESTGDHRVTSYNSRQSAQTNAYPGDSVPLFLSDYDGEPDSSEYITPLRKRRSSLSSRLLAGVCAAAAVAVLVALFFSNVSREMVVNLKAAAVFPALSAAAHSDPSQLTIRDGQNEPARPAPTENQTPAVGAITTVAAAPPREEIKLAYQNALEGRAPAAVAVTETPAEVVHHLDSDVIASLIKRADGLIASGDVAAARLVLRRAADAEDAHAAMTLAGTYDPAVLQKLGIHGSLPDVAMARSWYEKAKKFGSEEAPRRLEMLASKRQ